MLKAITYTDSEESLINEHLATPGLNGSAWEKDELKSIRNKIKDFYLKEQRNICVYCRIKLPSNNRRVWDIDHIISRNTNSRFMFEPKNLCVSCVDCNINKGVKKITNSQAKQKYPNKFTISHPHFDQYESHIKIVETGKYYIAKTSKGEQTISVFRLNRFYAFSEYEAEGTDLDEIQSLAAQLSVATTDKQKQDLYRQLAVAAISNIS